MTKKVIFTRSNTRIWIDVASELSDKYDWEPIYWIGYSDYKDRILEKFNNIIFHDLHDAVRGIPPSSERELSYPIDQEILGKLSICESYTLKMMDRMSRAGKFSYDDRIHHYHGLVAYWAAIVDKHKPDVVIFPTSPHLVYDFVLYTICKLKNIQTLMFERTNIPDLLMLSERFDRNPDALISKYNHLVSDEVVSVSLSDSANNYLKKLQGDYSKAIPIHTKYKLTKYYPRQYAKKKRYKFDQLFHRMKLVACQLQKLKNHRNLGLLRDYLVRKNRNINEYNTSLSVWVCERASNHVIRKKLMNYYQSRVENVDLSQPFIFVALQCQPERHTSPNGGYFVHQLLMIKLISCCIPSDWNIYVKEHISQFNSYQKAERGRSYKFYDDILSIPRVKFVDMSINSFKLIDAAKAVATVGGTVGFESINRGKPSLLFGHTWFSGCEGVYSIKTFNDCKNAIERIVNGVDINMENIRRFIAAIETVGVEGYLDVIYENKSKLDYEKNINSLVNSLISMNRR